ncbi:hypothetical protein H9L39_11342 [Fusarium oxysporum f. sp. albedinis]|nr:hypothetical protein H9L39_11342 [Fusarium oxysporum f. sp. albedinis]
MRVVNWSLTAPSGITRAEELYLVVAKQELDEIFQGCTDQEQDEIGKLPLKVREDRGKRPRTVTPMAMVVIPDVHVSRTPKSAFVIFNHQHFAFSDLPPLQTGP